MPPSLHVPLQSRASALHCLKLKASRADQRSMRCLLLLALALPSLAWGAEECADDFCRSLQEAGLSPRAYRLLQERVKADHYSKSYAAIVDYSLASNVPRFFLLSLSARSFQKYFASAGLGSGGQNAVLFGNTPHIRQSALGFMRTSPHNGKFGASILLTGLSASNSRLTPEAEILIHCAEYSSQGFFDLYGFWGRSLGCFTVPCENIQEIITHLGNDALVLSYHDALWDQTLTNPIKQEIAGHDAIPAPTKWELEENQLGKAGGPYGKKYEHPPIGAAK